MKVARPNTDQSLPHIGTTTVTASGSNDCLARSPNKTSNGNHVAASSSAFSASMAPSRAAGTASSDSTDQRSPGSSA